MSSKSTIKFKDALTKYYQLKGKYESKINKSIQEIVQNDNLPKLEKQEAFKSLKKKCINCGKNGGTLFSQNNNILSAKCGSIDNPCNLDIQLQKASYSSLPNDLISNNKSINSLKEKIIQSKLDYLYGFKDKDNTLILFNQLKEDLVKIIKIYQKNTNEYLIATQNLDNIENIQKLEETLSLEVNNFKELISNFNTSKSKPFIQEAIQLYINRIESINKNISSLKYKFNYVEKNNYTNENVLIQKSYSTNDLLNIIPGTENKIIAFSL